MTHCIKVHRRWCFIACAVHRGGLSLLHKILRVISGVLVRDAAARGEALNGRPYYRIFLGLIAELAPAFPADPEADPTRLSLIAMVAHVLEELQPQRVPGFAFPWLELISHRYVYSLILMIACMLGEMAFDHWC